MAEILSKTESVCPVCLAVIDAARVARADGIYLEKTCPQHGDFSALIWAGNKASYAAWNDGNEARDSFPAARPAESGCPRDCGLCTDHVRAACCVLLELTARCNLRCPVCFARAGETERPDPALSDIAALFDNLMAAGGPFNIQLSGGEPTVRDDLPDILRLGREKGFSFFQLNTNGLRLAREDGYAKTLKEAGLDCVFLQYDGISAAPHRTLRGINLMMDKELAIDSCAEVGLGVVLVPTLAPGVNVGEIGAILRYALDRTPTVRGVHFQPVSYFGRCALDVPVRRLTIPDMLREIETQTNGQMKAADFVGGGAENPYCSFHANYLRQGGQLKRVGREKARSGCCGVTSKQSRESVARQWSEPQAVAGDDGFAAFLREREENTFAVSGMLFQDAWTLDLDRLRRCYICEADPARGLVPFCAYNLTDTAGNSLYRK